MVTRQILLGLRSRLAGAQELMDGEDLDAAEVDEALRTLGTINRLWGGHLLMRRELASVLPGVRGPVRILDVATGWADMPRALARWARHQGLPVEIVSRIPATQSIYIIADKNPQPLVAIFDITGDMEPFISTRIKMGESSKVRVLVKAAGKFYVATQDVKVTIGGCGG